MGKKVKTMFLYTKVSALLGISAGTSAHDLTGLLEGDMTHFLRQIALGLAA